MGHPSGLVRLEFDWFLIARQGSSGASHRRRRLLPERPVLVWPCVSSAFRNANPKKGLTRLTFARESRCRTRVSIMEDEEVDDNPLYVHAEEEDFDVHCNELYVNFGEDVLDEEIWMR